MALGKTGSCLLVVALAQASLLAPIPRARAAPAPPALRCPGRPGVQQVVRAALQQLEVYASPSRLRSTRSRLAWSSLLPRLSARLSRSNASRALIDTYPDPRIDQNSYLALRWEVGATWDLSRLLFDPRELGITTRAVQLARWRQSVAEEVVQLYFERCRLLVMTGEAGVAADTRGGPALSGGTDPGERLRLQTRLSSVTALLDVMTGGLLSKESRAR